MSKTCLNCKSVHSVPAMFLNQYQPLTRYLGQTSLVLASFSAFGYRQFAILLLALWLVRVGLLLVSGIRRLGCVHRWRLTSSNESRIKYRIVVTSRFWPTRWMRQRACSSIIGFQWGSRRYAREPVVRSRLPAPVSDGKHTLLIKNQLTRPHHKW